MRLTSDWTDAVLARLDNRLSAHASHPVALALSGGGDSVALLHLAVDWARRRGRRILALTVDHGLNARSADWTASAGRAARDVGCDWRALTWIGPKPDTGLQAAARQARHALIAEGAREAGASVILFGHTRDDIAEADWMREQGAPIGRLQEWSPSPVWPEGRDLMLLRPLLDVSREVLRRELRDRGAEWIDDPANADPRFLRTHARQARAEPAAPAQPTELARDMACDSAGIISGALVSPWLAQAIACASGRASVPSRAKVEAARARLAGGATAATLSGSRLVMDGAHVRIIREPGRTSLPTIGLPPDTPRVWDGRWLFHTRERGWRVAPAGGVMAKLEPGDRERLKALPSPARAAHPVLFRDGDPRPVLASPAVEARGLVAGRLRLACGGAQREDDLGVAPWRGPDHRPI